MSVSFVHLNVHSCYSMLRGASSLDELLEKASGMDMDSLALTDINTLGGAVKFHEQAKKRGIKPLIGVDVKHKSGNAVLLAKNEKGYARICEILTTLKLNSPVYLLHHL